MVDAGVSKTPVRKDVRVRLPPRVLQIGAAQRGRFIPISFGSFVIAAVTGSGFSPRP